ncbi:DUF4013 domain-containing protein [Methanobacterium alkalithermotolerans]|uniref:DUF4013 domain-containing protein n=1 Tax=Methanobacterium alkalithermotolerans TaxID=2731220 RepID=A0A8T8K207_9EURY|nr:DUF4013 domain-containing protein [Methanobacterium alkalithermotolerans]QUH22516.1 DUF4013 domain-containing protein [Methanobacterium alkalithermotolerans]
MDIDQNIVNSLEYARSSWGKVATLGGILFVPFLILFVFIFIGAISNNGFVLGLLIFIGILIMLIAFFLVNGYFFRVIKSTLAGLDEMPDFDDWGELTVDGLKVLLVQLIYTIIFGILAVIPIFIIFLILGLIGSFLGIAGSMADPSTLSPAFLAGSGVFIWVMYLGIFLSYLIMIPVGLLYYIVTFIGISNMAYQDNMGSAFAISEIRERISSIRWGKVIIRVIATYFVTTMAVLVSYVLGLLLVGIILVPIIILPFLTIFMARSTGLLYLNE